MNRFTSTLAVVLFAFLASLHSLTAQSTGAGAIQGIVTDQTGGTLAGASIHIVKTSTNEAFDTTSNSAGFYTVPNLFVGDYKVDVAIAGMAKWEASVTLQVGQIAVIDPHLKVGSVSADITVAGDKTVAINTEDVTIASTVGHRQIEQLPMNGRSVAGLINTTIAGYEGPSNTNQPRVNGMVTAAFSWTQDGAPLDYRDGGGLDQVPPDPDTVQEVRVETSNSPASSDRPAYAIWSTKSGSNAIHGSAFETNRDSSFGVAHNRQDSVSAKTPQYIRNEYGASTGGPVYIPSFGKGKPIYDGRNKTFFFGAWNGISLRQQVFAYYYVPTLDMRMGNFSQATAANGTLYKIYDPQTTTPGSISGSNVTGWQRTQFSQNQIPLQRISPLAKALYAITPLPTNAGNPYAASVGNWQGPDPTYQQGYGFTMRFDHHFSDQNAAFFRYTKGHRLQYNLGASYGAPTTDDVWNGVYQPLDSQSGVLSYTHISSPNFSQTATVSMDYQSWRQQGSPGNTVNQDFADQLGLQNTFAIPGLPIVEGSNASSVGAQNSLLEGYGPGASPWRDSDYINTFADNFTWVKGRHQVQFGAEYRHDQLRIKSGGGIPNTAVYGGNGTADLNLSSGTGLSPTPFTGLAAADFFLGNAASYVVGLSPQYLYLRDQETDVFIQDDFHVHPNLTLNVGLRYEALPAFHERFNQFSSFDYNTGAIVTGQSTAQLVAEGRTTSQLLTALGNIGVKFETPDQAGMPAGVFDSYFFNFLPRVGVNYLPFGDHGGLVIRGGYGDYAYKTPLRNLYSGFNESVPFVTNYTQNYNSAAQTDGYTNYQLRSAQTVVSGMNSANAINLNLQSAITPGSFSYTTAASDLKPEGYREWNVNVQQDLRHHTSISVAYIGNHGYNLEQQWYTNTAPSPYVYYTTTGMALPTGYYSNTATREYNKTTYGEIIQFRKTGFANDNMLQVDFRRLSYKGIEFHVSEVWGKFFRAGGNGFRDGMAYEPGVYLPNSVPTDPHSLDRFEDYIQDTSIPRNHVKYDWVVSLPFGRGRHFLSHSNRLVDGLIGGWELSGAGNMIQTITQLSTTDYGPFSQLHTYGRSKPIMDCTGSPCHRAYLAYNGFITAAQLNTPNGYQGIPGGYVPEHSPLNIAQNNQNVNVTLANGTVITNVAYTPGPTGALNPNFRTNIDNPFDYQTDASLFKVIRITDRIGFKVNGDFFNVFNQQGTGTINGATGIIGTTTSRNTARIIQIGGRLTW